MTSETAEAIAEAFREHRDAFGVPITFGAAPEITAIVAEGEFSRELMQGGFAEAGNYQVTLLLSDLTAAPVNGDPVTYQAREFRVSSVAIQPGGKIGEYEIRPAKR